MPKSDFVSVPSSCTLCPRRVQSRPRRRTVRFLWGGPYFESRPGGPAFLGGAVHQRHPGSGTVFFLRLHPQVLLLPELSHQRRGPWQGDQRGTSGRDFPGLQEQGANNINLVTPGQWRPWIIAALDIARARGLHLPIVCNTGGYETVESVEAWRGYIDIWLADLKYVSSSLSAELSSAPDYFAQAKPAIEAMMAQAGRPVFNGEGILQKGASFSGTLPCPAT